jgi:hypothetical protein
MMMKNFLLAVAVMSPSILLAQSPFDGTWKTANDQSKLSQKPIVFALNNGMYDSTSAVPEVHVKADGKDQAVSGQPYDTLAVTEVDAHTVQLVYKKNGKTIREATDTASADGKTLTYKAKSYPQASDQVITTESTLQRVSEAPAGANGVSGSWQIQTWSASDNDLLETYKRNGDELTYSTPTGETWTAKFDGNDYPVKGSYSIDTVSLKEISERQIEISFKRGGKLIGVNTIKVSKKGKKMTSVDESKLTGRVSTYVSVKQ